MVKASPDETIREFHALVKSARKSLCGVDGCTCGGSLGQRMSYPTTDDGRRIEIVDLPFGETMIRVLPR
ncbi:MAG: hypothetical protein MUD15_07350 [Desulfobacterota bacterium]|nr:hypothetical protein [Thermodesulfobacteriota bacterium]